MIFCAPIGVRGLGISGCIKGNTRKRKQLGLGGSPTKRHKKQKLAVQKSLPTLNTRSSPKQLFLAMMGLSERQKEAIIQMGFGGLIGFCVNGVPEKLAYHVVDNFDAHSMTLNLGNSDLLVDGGVITKLLGIRDSGSNFADVEEARMLHPCRYTPCAGRPGRRHGAKCRR
ncbi:hypothetical protein Hanom_Chr01g00069381 [Helianthus anomalus]